MQGKRVAETGEPSATQRRCDGLWGTWALKSSRPFSQPAAGSTGERRGSNGRLGGGRLQGDLRGRGLAQRCGGDHHWRISGHPHRPGSPEREHGSLPTHGAAGASDRVGQRGSCRLVEVPRVRPPGFEGRLSRWDRPSSSALRALSTEKIGRGRSMNRTPLGGTAQLGDGEKISGLRHSPPGTSDTAGRCRGRTPTAEAAL